MHRIESKRTRQQMLECSTECMDTQRTILATVRYCMDRGGRYVSAQFVRLMLDTAAVCQSAAEASRDGSGLFTFSSTSCAEVCKLCATACRRFAEDEIMLRCAEVCEHCAMRCRQVNALAAAV